MIKKTIVGLTVAGFCLFNWFDLGMAQTSGKVAVLWCDPLLNISKLGTRTGILNILESAESSGFQAIALGVKGINGQVLYDSKIAPRLLEWKNTRVPLDFDMVQTFINEAHRKSLQVYAVFPVFSEGEMLERVGPLYDDHLDWQSMVYVVEDGEPQIIPMTQWAYGPVAFANPHLSAVQDYEISVIKEFTQKYSMDGIILDKIRFSGLEADFSDQTREQFEQLTGTKVDWWPQDIFEWQQSDGEWQIVPGRQFNAWLEFRAKSMQKFVGRVVTEVQKLDATLPIGNFTGSWYPTYYEYGINWASQNNIPEDSWATAEYNKTAIAEKLNYSVVGCFFPRVTIRDAEDVGAEWWMSVEGGATVSMEVIDQVTPVYAAILVEQFKNDEEKFKESIRMALELTNGLYLTDYSTIEKYEYWDEIRSILGATAGNTGR